MTREEAKGNLIHAIRWNDMPKKEALDIAIKALEQELCEDCISRAYIEPIVEELENICANGDERILDLLADIKNAPPVTPQPKAGHWIGHREHCENLGVIPSGLGAYEWCSNCDCGIDVREWHRNHYNYCPNCGAKMVEPQAESEGDKCQA